MALVDLWVLRQVPVVFARFGMLLGKYWDGPLRRERLQLLLATRSKVDLLMLPGEACQLMSAVDAVARIEGDMAELGVASGASARIIAARAPHRALHLFDTFEGLPDPGSANDPRFEKGQYAYSLERVRAYLGEGQFRYHQGLFPQSAAELGHLRFAFVHLDGDLYESTLAGLEWFYPRLNPGGILICHDFDSSVGVNRAFAEFFADKPEPYIGLTGSQCLFVKQ